MKKLHVRKLEELLTTSIPKAWGEPIWMAHGFMSGREWGEFVSMVKGNPHKP